MDKILMGYDFSDNSDCALKMAITIAKESGCGLELVWVDNSLDDLVQIMKESVRKAVEKKLQDVVADNIEKLPGGRFTYNIGNGKVYEYLSARAQAEDAVLIIIGTHGKSGIETRWTGSNAARLVHIAQCPILSIPMGGECHSTLKRIIFPVDFVFSTRQKAPIVAWIAQQFGSYVYILGILTSTIPSHIEKVEEYVREVGTFFVNNHVPYELVYRNVKNIAKEVLAYAKEKDADLIAIMTEQETAFQNIFIGTYAQQIVSMSKIPVLTKQPENINTLDQENLGT